MNWVLDADIRGFYDAIDHGWMLKFLEHRIADRRMLRLIGKWLKAGVIEDGEWSETVEGRRKERRLRRCSLTFTSTTCSTCGPTGGDAGTRMAR